MSESPRQDSSPGPTPLSAPLRTGGLVKFVSDVAVVAEIKLRMSALVWHWQLFAVLAMPLPLFFLTSTFVPDDSAALRRIIAGTLLFGIAFSIGLLVGNQFAYERFSRVQKLYVMMPVTKTAYVVGSLAHLSLMGVASVIVLSAFAMTRGIDVKIAWTLGSVDIYIILGRCQQLNYLQNNGHGCWSSFVVSQTCMSDRSPTVSGSSRPSSG